MKLIANVFGFVRTGFQRLRALFIKRRLDGEFDQEIQTHLALLTEEQIRRGMTPDEARYAALRSFGGVTQVKEHNREQRGLPQVDVLLQDLRYAFRSLRKSPGFAAVAILTLAFSIGANTAIFQLLDAVRIRTLPVVNPQELVEIRLTNGDDRRGSRSRFGELTNPLWEQIRSSSHSFAGMLAWGGTRLNLRNGGEARYAKVMMVSGDFFNVLGIHAFRGRVFSAADDGQGCGASAAVISYAFWQRELGGSPAAVGSTVSLNSHAVEIVGITPATFFGMEVGQSYDVAVPLCAEPTVHSENSRLANGTVWWLVVLARMKPGSSLASVNAHLHAISPGVFQSTLPPNYPTESVKSYLDFKLAAYPAGAGVSQLRDDYSDSLGLLLGASFLVLLIGCANLANLTLARASARERESAVRMALGASRLRILRQWMTECFLLAGLGSFLGLGLAKGLSALLISFLDVNGNPVFLDLKADWRVLGFNACLAIVTCLLFGTTAALRATATAPGVAMKSGSHSMTASRERFGLRKLLVVAQVSLSVVLLAGALLFARSLRNLLTVDPGFRQNGVLIAGLDFSRLHLPPERCLDFTRVLLDRLSAVPGIQSAATTEIVPISGDSWSNSVWMEGLDSRREMALFNNVGPDYFKALRITVVAGRAFDDRDTASSRKVAIVNEAFAQKLTNGASPVGQRFRRQRTPRQPETLYEIVGLVKNTKYLWLQEDFRPIAFLPSFQDPNPDSTARVMLRSDLPPADARSAVKRALSELSPEIAIEFDSLKEVVQDSLLRERLLATLAGFFGLLALLLAAIGLYGVISYMVAQRTNEIGIRMALGANRGSVLRMVMGQATVLLGIGLGVGIALAWIGAKAVHSMLFGLKPGDPITFLSAALLLAAVTLSASYLPSHRAAQLDPLVALREE